MAGKIISAVYVQPAEEFLIPCKDLFQGIKNRLLPKRRGRGEKDILTPLYQV